MKTLLAGVRILGITVAGFGCSDGGTTDGAGGMPSGTGGAGSGATGGMPASGGQGATGGSSGAAGGMGGAGTGGAGTGGAGTGGTGTGGAGTGGTGTGGESAGMGGAGRGGGGRGPGRGGASTGGAGAGGAATGGASGGGSGGTGGAFTGTCTASKSVGGANVSGTGPHDVIVETNSENGIKCGTIFRPADLGGGEKYPIFVWGEGGCSQNGQSNQAAMAEIASWGYFIVADGTPGGNGACTGGQDGKALLDYITWVTAENDKPCSAYYQSIETTKVAADGFSCGGLMSENASDDPRFTAIGITSSGLMGSSPAVWDAIHTPFKIMNGGPDDVAYPNGLRDYDGISSRGIPIVYFSKTSAGHGGDLGQGRGDFNLVNLAWLNWQLKGDEGATGKGYLYGPTCDICTDSGWVYKSANID